MTTTPHLWSTVSAVFAEKLGTSAPAVPPPVAAAAGDGVRGLMRRHALPVLAGVGVGIAGKRLYDNVTYAEEHRAQGVRV